MKRRTFIASAAAAAALPLARPAIGANPKTLIFVPQANLTSLDPVWTTATVTRNFSLMVYETLYGRDQSFNPQPQMVEGHTIDDDGRRWTMKLREGLVFHDGTPVLARDCVASLQRWLKRDAVSETFNARVDAIEAPDDRTLVWRLKKPFPLLAHFLSKVQPQPVIVPARLAATDPFKQLTDIVGCGPFRFLPDEFVSGSHAAFARFDKYVPRQEPASYTAGGHKVLLDRVEWRIIPDASTSANAISAGEVDWLELPSPDLIPMLKRASGVTTGLLDIYGTVAILRPNSSIAPTSNVGVRKAMMAAVDPREAMIAAMGEDESGWRAPMGYFLPGSPAANDAGMEYRRKRWSTGDVKAMLDKAGYGGERIVLLHPTDQIIYNAFITVVADAVPQGRAEHRRADGGLGDGGAAPHQQGDGGEGRLVDLPRRRTGPGVRRSDAGEHAAKPRREGVVRLAGRSEDRGGVRGMDRFAKRRRTPQTRSGVPGGGVRLRADDHARAVPAAGGVAVECDGAAEGIGAGVLGR